MNDSNPSTPVTAGSSKGFSLRLTSLQMSRMSRLLDEALPLDEAERLRWLDSLSPEDQDIATALREALILARPDHVEGLATLPKFDEAPPAPDGTGLVAGARVGPYELVRPLGTGGMAEVWLARRADGAFKRDVALKLPTFMRLRKDLEERFSRERDILAGLEHPNIARLYDAGTDSSGLPYLSLEYVVGQPITDWCDEHRLGIRDRLQLLLQVLDGVQYAHDRQVVHRDLKPSNILVNESRQVRLLDFGIAKLLVSEGPNTQITGLYGRALTPEYSSPELIRGDQVDARSDIYSLGILLYELLTGTRPYSLKTGQSIATLEQAITTVEVSKPSTMIEPRLCDARAVTPKRLIQLLRGDLDVVALKALAKEPKRRYQSVAEFSDDLRRYLAAQPVMAQPPQFSYRVRKWVWRNRAMVVPAAAAIFSIIAVIGYELNRSTPIPKTASVAVPFTPPPHSVAVLPFTNLSADPNQEYFSDVITEELITALSRISSLKVTARTSAFSFKSKNTDIATIARVLNVAAILEGSIQRSGTTARITVQLINSLDGFNIWSQTYDRDVKDVIALQSDIAAIVAQKLRATMLADESTKVADRGTQNLKAFDLWLIGVHFQYDDPLKAAANFQQAVRLDPFFVRGWTALSMIYGNRAADDPARAAMWFSRSRAAAENALRLGPNLLGPHYAKAWTCMNELDWRCAEREVAETERIDSRNMLTLLARSNLEFRLGRWQQANAVVREALERDPLNFGLLNTLAGVLSASGQHHEAAQVYRRALQVDPLVPTEHSSIALEELLDGHPAEAISEAQLESAELDRQEALLMAYFALGRRAESDSMLAVLKKKYTSGHEFDMAYVHAFRGELDMTFQLLDRAVLQHNPLLCVIKGGIGAFPNVKSDPRYVAILHKLGLTE